MHIKCSRARRKAKVPACLLGRGPVHLSYHADDEEEREKMGLHWAVLHKFRDDLNCISLSGVRGQTFMVLMLPTSRDDFV